MGAARVGDDELRHLWLAHRCRPTVSKPCAFMQGGRNPLREGRGGAPGVEGRAYACVHASLAPQQPQLGQTRSCDVTERKRQHEDVKHFKLGETGIERERTLSLIIASLKERGRELVGRARQPMRNCFLLLRERPVSHERDEHACGVHNASKCARLRLGVDVSMQRSPRHERGKARAEAYSASNVLLELVNRHSRACREEDFGCGRPRRIRAAQRVCGTQVVHACRTEGHLVRRARSHGLLELRAQHLGFTPRDDGCVQRSSGCFHTHHPPGQNGPWPP